ncbi:hypothetical protein D3C84_1220920 [compost metagenome]
MAHANGVAAHRLQLLQPSDPYLLRDSRSQAACIMMDADAFYFHIDAIQEEARLRIKCK